MNLYIMCVIFLAISSRVIRYEVTNFDANMTLKSLICLGCDLARACSRSRCSIEYIQGQRGVSNEKVERGESLLLSIKNFFYLCSNYLVIYFVLYT